jgi:hypothetical protein
MQSRFLGNLRTPLSGRVRGSSLSLSMLDDDKAGAKHSHENKTIGKSKKGATHSYPGYPRFVLSAREQVDIYRA